MRDGWSQPGDCKMQEVEKHFHEDTYGDLKAREARLRERHDRYIQNREAEEIRRIAQQKLIDKVLPKRRSGLVKPSTT